MTKRGFDLLFALVGLILILPVLLLVWVGNQLDDGGPIFFWQTRVGQHGRLFQIVKFRTMSVGADKVGPSITASDDRRITRIGRVLRKTKLDELPQLWNVLHGEMSFVGPRPEVPKYVALYSAAQRAVLDLRPGITDEASVAFRDEESLLSTVTDPERYYIEHCLPRKIAINLAYAKCATVFRDVLVILRTIYLVWMRH
jgi:lipopolysaccharide/colanic/teichoic acid biosynthesis glycosyltransferase